MTKRRVYHCWELERSSSGASSEPTRGQRVPDVVVTPPGVRSCRHGLLPVHCPLCWPASCEIPAGVLDDIFSGRHKEAVEKVINAGAPKSEIPAMPPHPPDDGAARPGWISKWEFERAGERVRIVVEALGPNGDERILDAREFIERLGDAIEGTVFVVHVETVAKEPDADVHRG